MYKVFIKTFGCQMNDRDSEALAGLFVDAGYEITSQESIADVILVNTCSVRLHAEDRAISFLGTLKKSADSVKRIAYSEEIDRESESLNAVRCTLHAKRVIALIGCMAKARGEEVAKRMPHVNLVCSSAAEDKIIEYVGRLQAGEKRIIDLDDRPRIDEYYSGMFRLDKECAQVVISTGCSNYCAYCIVPYVRGGIRLRDPRDILDEVSRSVKNGAKKITLLGQNVNDYRSKLKINDQLQTDVDFVWLLKMVSEIEGVEEIDFVTSHPKNTSLELFELMAADPKIKKILHLPFQSGSDKILTAMNRGYTRDFYLKLAADYRRITGGKLGTDVIVGFPGETDEDFQATYDLIEQVGFEYSYLFMYSPRPHSTALNLTDDVPKEVKEKRHAKLLELQKKIAKSKKIMTKL